MKKKEEEEMKHVKKQFKAKPVPKSTSEPRFQKLQDSQKARRRKVKENCAAITLAREKPFSFYEREKNKKK